MSKLGSAKIYGGIGAILTLIGSFLPYGVVSLIGIVLVFIAVKYISDEAKETGIFQNYLISFIFRICSIFALVAVTIIVVGSVSLKNIEKFSNPKDLFEGLAGSVLVGIIIGIIAMWIFWIIAAIYLRKSYDSIAQHTKVDLFKTTGMLYFIGAITTIVLIGFIILLIAIILEIVSYFSLPEELPT